MTPDFNPYNPYGYREEIPGWEKMTDEEREQAAHTHLLCGCATYAIGFAVILLLCWLFSGCTTTKYVAVPQQHTEHHWHTDTVRERDSTHTERETIIREVDSAAMARYGIQMEKNQRAWLILQREMEQRLRELEHKSAVRDTVHDSIPKPYPVEVVKTETTGWWAFWGLIVAIVAIGAIVIIKKLKN